MTGSLRVVEPDLVDEPGVARALQVTFVSSLASALAVFVVSRFLLRWVMVPRLALVAAASCVVALAFSRSRWKRSGILLGLAGLAYCAFHVAAKNDGMQSIGLAIIPVLIIIGSLVLHRLMFGVLCAAALFSTAGMLAIRYYVLQVE